MSMMPPARLDREPWRARPTATPAEASTVSTEAMGTPRMPTMEMARMTNSTPWAAEWA